MTPPLTYPFLRYIESTRHLVLYRVDSTYPFPSMLRLPEVETLCLLDCSPQAVGRMLYPPFFPRLRRIDYLSGVPSDGSVYQRFPSAEWVFPWRAGRCVPFYDGMVAAGRGRMDAGLLSQYLVRWNTSWMDVYLPGRGLVSGKDYMNQQMAYLHKKHCDGYCVPYPIVLEDRMLPKGDTPHAVSNLRWVSGEHLEEKENRFEREVLHLPFSNRLGATPFHSSGR